jgi:serine/threonine-protein kinase
MDKRVAVKVIHPQFAKNAEAVGRFLSEAEAAAALMLLVLNAVASAHEAGIVHRDLKPENIFIARAGDGSIRPVVLDFGVAKIEASAIQGLTQTNAMVGTVVYLPSKRGTPSASTPRAISTRSG